nr:cystathionine beta-lyase [Entomobacter blattae]
MLERVSQGWRTLATMLVEAGREKARENGSFVNPPLERGSTVLFPSVSAMQKQGQRLYEHETIYGAMGSPNQHRLEQVVATIEGASHTQVVCSGLAACALPLLTFLAHGGHCLMPDSVYGPTRRFANTILKRFGVSTTYYPPLATAEEISTLIQSNTQVLFSESPGSHTFEFQDVAMLAAVAHENGAKLIMDNTWGIGIFKPFEHGVDVSIQALTKFPGGHSDAILGAVSVQEEEDWHSLRDAAVQLGQMAGPDACWLTLRGLRTMAVRLEHQAISAYRVASWLKKRPEVAQLLHPAFEDSPGHEFWMRDFSGAAPLFGVVFKPDYTYQDLERMVDALKRFGIGASWGGYESLVLPSLGSVTRNVSKPFPGPMCRFYIGLENWQDLVADIEHAFHSLSTSKMVQN